VARVGEIVDKTRRGRKKIKTVRGSYTCVYTNNNKHGGESRLRNTPHFIRLVRTYFSLFRKSTQPSVLALPSALTGCLTELNEFDNRRFCKVRSIRIGEGTKIVLGMVKSVYGVPTIKMCVRYVAVTERVGVADNNVTEGPCIGS
jgi:hypothetical protein